MSDGGTEVIIILGISHYSLIMGSGILHSSLCLTFRKSWFQSPHATVHTLTMTQSPVFRFLQAGELDLSAAGLIVSIAH